MAIKEPTPEDIKASYGFVALLADSIPEIRDLLAQAVGGQWTADRFVMSVANTNWFKTTPQAQRDWIIKMATDPASAETDAQSGMATIMSDLQQLGIGVDVGLTGRFTVDDRLRALYVGARTKGLFENEAARRKYVFETIMADPGGHKREDFGGIYGNLVGEMFKLAKDFGYTPTDLQDEIFRNTDAIMRSGATVDASTFRTKMINYASAKFAPYAEDIRGGKTVSEVARPIIDRVSDLLEMNPDALDLTDPIMKKALTEWGAENRAYSLNEIENFARQDARWKTTDNAMENSVKLLNEIGQTFGFLGNR